ncbi:MAG: pseudouridine synthase [Rhodanobacter lindaniclasticus]|uniref:Pseudouridine synthase n=1 Tax=Rhodanobacter lindaniclasticus TaxID=75310 RepID=A0A4S3KEX5_9GAMM|nr:pseudouridine synthase [Rhodanobacter lindaniclasticus]THD07040.1 pseudouridine synthase [Rhodanobacter lindaniclasticus]
MSRSSSFHSARASASAPSPRYGLARVLSKLGMCSRSQAEQWIRAGRVSLDGRVVHDPQHPTSIEGGQVAVDGKPVHQAGHVHIAFNKPRGIVVSAADEHGRATVYTALAAAGLPWLGPVGRLDKASEGLLLLSNDTRWAAGITDPATHLEKTYHVQVAGLPDAAVLEAMLAGVEDAGELLRARRATLLRAGAKNAWLEVVLDEGRNRHIRRLLAALGFDVLRLVRVAIGPLALGELAKGQWRRLSTDEVEALDTHKA